MNTAAPLLSPAEVARSASARAGALRMVSAYVSLTKPRIIALLVLTTPCTMAVAGESLRPLSLVLLTVAGGALAAGAASAVNCYLDGDIDALMERTSRRPLPAGLIRPERALVFGLTLGALSFVVLAVWVNLLAALLAQLAFLFYVFVYTRCLKRTSPHNIVIGGAAGAMPPLIGWAAVTGEIGLLAISLFAIIFFWTPPHFWALSLLIKRDYERARIPMLPVARGDEETRRQILRYTLLLTALTIGVVAMRLAGGFYLAAAAVLGALFVYSAARLWRERSAPAARRLFRYSIAYLALLFVALVVDVRVLPSIEAIGG